MDGSFQQKWDTNTMACTDEESVVGKESGLFLILSRMNHDCLGNTDHQYMAHRGVKILVASRSIKKGEEITISYLGSYKPKAERRDKLRRYPYLFECQCTVCVNDEVDQKLARANELDNSILELGGLGKIEAAMRKGRALIAIYDQMQMSSWLYQRTYYDLFQVAITKRKHNKDALRFIRLAHEAVLAYTKDKHHPEVVRFKELMASPENHRNYRLLD